MLVYGGLAQARAVVDIPNREMYADGLPQNPTEAGDAANGGGIAVNAPQTLSATF